MTTAFALLPDELPEVPVCFGPYKVIGSIAEGGMGIVLRGQDLRTGGMVALKTVRSPRSADAHSMRREIRALGQMSHPGIVRLIADGSWNGMPWMAMELLRGQSVREEIESLWGNGSATRLGPRPVPCHSDDLPTMPARGRADGRRGTRPFRMAHPLPAAGRLRDVLAIVVQLCQALEYVHALRLVHRDVKPANVFLGEDGRVTLLDFGLVCPARGASVPCATAEICVGTMEYAAPEQIRGESVDARADIYSLGCLLYELVTGRRLTDVGFCSGMVERQLARDPAAPFQLVSCVPHQLETLLLAMLAHRPDDRPSARGVAETLTGVAEQLS